MIAATSGTPLVPLVRVPAATPWHAKQLLDLGAMGNRFSMTTRAHDAAAAD
jgi:4-hydroxy-2-oxoheptanedioate aldolase